MKAISNMSKWLERNSGFLAWTVGMVLLIAASDPVFAQISNSAATQLTTKAQSSMTIINIIVYFVLIVCVIGAGIAAMFGRMEWAVFGRVLIGACVVGVAVPLVEGLSGLTSSGGTSTGT